MNKVCLYSTRLSFPFWFAKHTWFVIYESNKTERWEVHWHLNKQQPEYGYIFKNALPEKMSFEIFKYITKFRWKTVLINTYTEKEAKAIKKTLRSSTNSYKYKNFYKLKSPNSNTYTSWVLRQSGLDIKVLPKSAIGKNYGSK